MAEKKYPVKSILVAIVWAVFFYPQDRAPSAPQVTRSSTVVPAKQNAVAQRGNARQIKANSEPIPAFVAGGRNIMSMSARERR